MKTHKANRKSATDYVNKRYDTPENEKNGQKRHTRLKVPFPISSTKHKSANLKSVNNLSRNAKHTAASDEAIREKIMAVVNALIEAHGRVMVANKSRLVFTRKIRKIQRETTLIIGDGKKSPSG